MCGKWNSYAGKNGRNLFHCVCNLLCWVALIGSIVMLCSSHQHSWCRFVCIQKYKWRLYQLQSFTFFRLLLHSLICALDVKFCCCFCVHKCACLTFVRNTSDVRVIICICTCMCELCVHCTGCSKKITPRKFFVTVASNVGRLSEFFHRHSQQYIYNRMIVKGPTSPQTLCRTTLWRSIDVSFES